MEGLHDDLGGWGEGYRKEKRRSCGEEGRAKGFQRTRNRKGGVVTDTKTKHKKVIFLFFTGVILVFSCYFRRA
jgi:hypothetical protein